MEIHPELEIQEITPEELVKKMSQYDVIDVRTSMEFHSSQGHIKGSRRLTLGQETTTFLENADKSKNYVFVCRLGQRAIFLTKEAIQRGFTNAFNLVGGINRWEELGYDLES